MTAPSSPATRPIRGPAWAARPSRRRATPRPRGPRHLRIPLPGFGVAHPATAPSPGRAPILARPAPPGPASRPAQPGRPACRGRADAPASRAATSHDPQSASLTGASSGRPGACPLRHRPQARPPSPAATAPPDGTTPPLDIDQIASQVYERIGDKMDHRPDTAQDTPPAEQAIMLRDKAPELYDLWLKIAQEKAATSNYVQRAPYEVPERLAQSGRPRALSAMIVVLAFCGYLASLGGPGPYIGGLIAILDLLVMLALFFGLRPDHLTDSGRPRKRRLIRRPAQGGPVQGGPVQGGPVQAARPLGHPGILSPPAPDATGGLSSYRRISARPVFRISTTA